MEGFISDLDLKPELVTQIKNRRLLNSLGKNQFKDSDKDYDIHQEILDLCYEELDKTKTENNTYEWDGKIHGHSWNFNLLIDFVYEHYGRLAAFAVQIGKYNQQVCNGGHEQYWDNEYASIRGKYKDITLHAQLLEMTEDFLRDLSDIPTLDSENHIKVTKEAINILENFIDNFEIQTEITILNSDRSGQLFEGSSEASYELTENFRASLEEDDEQYYYLNERLMKLIKEYLSFRIFKGEN